MSEHMYKHSELVTALIKHQGIHEGLWQLSITFGFAAANVGENPESLNPASVTQIAAIGIRPADSLSNIAVDAAAVNPP
jgi:hypothetical protein